MVGRRAAQQAIPAGPARVLTVSPIVLAGRPRLRRAHRQRRRRRHVDLRARQIWCELVAMAYELLAWMQMLALDGPARSWEPKRLRLRLFAAAGPATADGPGCVSPRPGPGPHSSPPRSPGCKPSLPADHHHPSRRQKGQNPRARGTPPTRRDSRPATHGQALKITSQPNTSGQQITGAIEAKLIARPGDTADLVSTGFHWC